MLPVGKCPHLPASPFQDPEIIKIVMNALASALAPAGDNPSDSVLVNPPNAAAGTVVVYISCSARYVPLSVCLLVLQSWI